MRIRTQVERVSVGTHGAMRAARCILKSGRGLWKSPMGRPVRMAGNTHGVVTAAVLGLSACTPGARPDADARAIATLRAEFQAAENHGRPDEAIATLAQDVILMPPNRPALGGIDAASEYLRRGLESSTMAIEYTSRETVVAGDWAFDRGNYRFNATPKSGGETHTSHGKYLWLARCATDGTWNWARLMWSGDTPPGN